MRFIEQPDLEVWRQAEESLDPRFGDTPYPCLYGHYDCSYEEAGPCQNEAIANEAARIEAEYDRRAR